MTAWSLTSYHPTAAGVKSLGSVVDYEGDSGHTSSGLCLLVQDAYKDSCLVWILGSGTELMLLKQQSSQSTGFQEMGMLQFADEKLAHFL